MINIKLRLKSELYNIYKKYKTSGNLIIFKKYKVIARKIIHQLKKQSWTNFQISLNNIVPSKELWNKVKAIQEII